MDEKKLNESGAELSDEQLNDAVGGRTHLSQRMASCKRCGQSVRETSLTGGYCKKCIQEMLDMGVHPVI